VGRRARATTWVVVESQDGTFELQRRGRPLAHGLSERALVQRMRRRVSDGDRIVRQEPDGYRSPARLSDFTGHRRKV
jgi:hypothetical protein